MFQGAGSNPVGSTAFPVLVGKVARRSRTGDLLKVTLTSPLSLTIITLELDGFMPRAECGPGFSFFGGLQSVALLPFPLTSGIISVCLDLAGLFRNKDIHLC
jgi:hypothetical protein